MNDEQQKLISTRDGELGGPQRDVWVKPALEQLSLNDALAGGPNTSTNDMSTPYS